MEEAAEASGYRYRERKGQKELRYHKAWLSADGDQDPEQQPQPDARADPEPDPQSDPESVETRSDWVGDATNRLPDDDPDNLPDQVINNKIARAKWSDETVDRMTPDNLNERISPGDRKQLLKHLLNE